MPDRKKRAGIWRVNEDWLDDRIEGQRDLVVSGEAGTPYCRRGRRDMNWGNEAIHTNYSFAAREIPGGV